MPINTIKSLLINYFPDNRSVDENILKNKGYEDFYLSAIRNGYLQRNGNGKLIITPKGKIYRNS